MPTRNRSLNPVPVAGQSPLPIGTAKYLREIAFVAAQAATSRDERVIKLSIQLLALQAPSLEALASQGVL